MIVWVGQLLFPIQWLFMSVSLTYFQWDCVFTGKDAREFNWDSLPKWPYSWWCRSETRQYLRQKKNRKKFNFSLSQRWQHSPSYYFPLPWYWLMMSSITDLREEPVHSPMWFWPFHLSLFQRGKFFSSREHFPRYNSFPLTAQISFPSASLSSFSLIELQGTVLGAFTICLQCTRRSYKQGSIRRKMW